MALDLLAGVTLIDAGRAKATDLAGRTQDAVAGRGLMRRFAHYHTLRYDLRAICPLVNRTRRDQKGRLRHLECWITSGNMLKLLLLIGGQFAPSSAVANFG